MRVLIAEDEPVARRVAQKAVQGFGHEVDVVEDGTAAWRRLQEVQYDVLISDWLMPGLDGLELCRRVRSRETGAYCYVILLTARRAKDDLVAGIMAGADDFVSKPFDHDVLRARLHTAERVTRLLKEVRTLRAQLPTCVRCNGVVTVSDALCAACAAGG
jgi:DNA-binding response OmpR family regulator